MGNKGETKERKRILRIIDKIVSLASGDEYVYRGQPDAAYLHVSSTLYRALEERYKESDDEWREWLKMDHDMDLIQDETLKDARRFASEDYDKDDGEILSSIQHYSGDTNLIDFTKDCYIALFFACSEKGGEEGGKPGKVFLLKTSDLKDSEVEMVTPTHPPNRVTAQKSVFVQSRTGIIPDGMMNSVEISLDLKQPILDYLRAYHGISGYTIYNDLHGYIRNRKAHGNAVIEGYLGINYSSKSDKAQSLEEKRGALKKAIEHFGKAIRLAPNFAEAYNNRGVAKGKLGDDEGAKNDCGKAIALDPYNVAAYNNRGNAKRELDDILGAINDYDKAVALDPYNVAVYNNRGLAKENLGDMAGAISDYGKSIMLAPDDATAYNNRGLAKRKLGNNEGAIKDSSIAIDLEPGYVEAYINRGITFEYLGNSQQALSDLEIAKQLAQMYNNQDMVDFIQKIIERVTAKISKP